MSTKTTKTHDEEPGLPVQVERDTHAEWRALNGPVAGLPAELDYDEFAGAGLEGVTADEVAMPMIVVLQANSPQCKPVKVGGVEGAQAGMLYNTVTGRCYDGEKGVGFLAVHRDHTYVEFYPRDEDGGGGGFLGVRSPSDPIIADLRRDNGQFGKLPHADDEGRPTELNETFSLAGWIVEDWDDPTSASRAVVPFSSTKIRGYKNFITSTDSWKYQSAKAPGKLIQLPLWSHRLTLRTTYRQKGSNGWYVIELVLAEQPKERSLVPRNSHFFELGAEMHRAFASGEARVQYERMEAEPATADADEVPF